MIRELLDSPADSLQERRALRMTSALLMPCLGLVGVEHGSSSCLCSREFLVQDTIEGPQCGLFGPNSVLKIGKLHKIQVAGLSENQRLELAGPASRSLS